MNDLIKPEEKIKEKDKTKSLPVKEEDELDGLYYRYMRLLPYSDVPAKEKGPPHHSMYPEYD